MAEAVLLVSVQGAGRAPAFTMHQGRELVGCGHAWHRAQVRIVDPETRHVCADTTEGEIWVSGASIAQGYWNNPAATEEKFSGHWCRTGDLASIDADGYLWYQGRADDMFKAAGYRIGPSEIENCLVKHPAVANAAVVPKPDKERGNVIKAFVVLTADTPRNRLADALLISELQQHVRGMLAPYEYPKEIEFIEQLPMTTTGKVQRRVLRLLEAERASAPS